MKRHNLSIGAAITHPRLKPAIKVVQPVTNITANFQKGKCVPASAAPDREGAGTYREMFGSLFFVEQLRLMLNDC